MGGNAGFHDEVFSALRTKAESSSHGRLLCSFMMDEIAIRKQLDFDPAGDKFIGHVDMEDEAALPLANEALFSWLCP